MNLGGIITLGNQEERNDAGGDKSDHGGDGNGPGKLVKADARCFHHGDFVISGKTAQPD